MAVCSPFSVRYGAIEMAAILRLLRKNRLRHESPAIKGYDVVGK